MTTDAESPRGRGSYKDQATSPEFCRSGALAANWVPDKAYGLSGVTKNCRSGALPRMWVPDKASAFPG